MKKTPKLPGLFVIVALLVTACGDSPENLGGPITLAPAESSGGAVELSDAPPKEGSCVGWRKSLAKGSRAGEVEYCLRELALRDRPKAVEEANLLLDWRIKEEAGYSQLKPLLAALSRYPQAGSLKDYLSGLDLLPNPPGEYSRLDQALTASDYISELGNIHWFDVETGMFPNNHDYLLAEIAALSGLKEARFTEQPPQSYEADNEPYLLSAEFRGQSYQQQGENHGDWYDLNAVLLLLNRMAVDQKMGDRFMVLPTGDQTAIVWVVDKETLTQLLKEGLISLSPVGLSMQEGKAFEEQALKTLR
jgi:hypothetical protein